MNSQNLTIEKLVSLCKRRWFIFAWSEIYWWFANSYTYWPYWAELKNNIKALWWKFFVHSRRDMTWIDWPILLHPRTWEASGHTSSFNDAQVDCKDCNARIRADHLIEEQKGIDSEWLPVDEMTKIIKDNNLICPKCWSKNLTDVRTFNLMFQTELSKTWDNNKAYMRPETAQAIFTEFKNIIDSQRVKLPFWVAQIGKAFRNEITPWNFTFRLLEFEQMEIEYFISPPPNFIEKRDEFMKKWSKLDDWHDEDVSHILDLFLDWQKDMKTWCHMIWLTKDNLRDKEHLPEKLSHYSKKTTDIEYHYPFWWSELYWLAYRTDFDLSQHEKHSGQELKYRNSETNEKFTPHVIEPTFWLDRTILAVLCDAYTEVEDPKTWTRIILKLDPKIAPVKVAILPLHAKKQWDYAGKIFKNLCMDFYCEYDDWWSIWKRYARQDEIGTPFCVTVDFDCVWEWENINPEFKDMVTVRFRDTWEQERVKVWELKWWIMERLR